MTCSSATKAAFAVVVLLIMVRLSKQQLHAKYINDEQRAN
jgi:hypothetical protein